MRKILIFILIFLLLFDTAFAQYRISGEINNFGFLKACFRRNWDNISADYYIPNFYYFNFRTKEYLEPNISTPTAPYKDYYIATDANPDFCLPVFSSNMIFGLIKLNKFLWKFNNYTRIALYDRELREINKIYVYKVKIYPNANNTYFIGNDLVAVIDNLNFNFLNSANVQIGPWNYIHFYVNLHYYFSTETESTIIQKDLNNINLDTRINSYGRWIYGINVDYSEVGGPEYYNEIKPNEMLIFIAEGKTENNEIKRKLIADISVGENNYLKILHYSNLFIFIEAPTGSFNPNDFDNKLVFKLYIPSGYNLYKWWLEIIDSNTGKNLYTSDVFNFTNYDLSYDKVVLDLNYYFNLKDVLVNLKNQGYSNLVLYLYVKLIDNNNNETPFLSSATTLELLGGISREEYTYKDWYSDIISTFGLSGATPTPIFLKAGEFIDKLFSFSLLPSFNLENKGKELAEKFNIFISYLKAFPLTSAFLLAIFASYSFRLAYRFIRLVTLR